MGSRSVCPHPIARKNSPPDTCVLCDLGGVPALPNTLEGRVVTPQDLDALKVGVIAEKCRRSFARFFREGWHVLEPGTPLDDNWHIDVVCDHVQAVIEGWRNRRVTPQQVQNLLVNIPPGTAKSRIVSVYFPAWVWIDSPEWRVICLSANPKVALRDAMYSRELLGSDWYQTLFKPKWSFKEDQDAKGKYENTRGGFRSSQGITAAIVGDRADALIVDDPHDPKDAQSDTKRQSVLDKWDQSARNRLNSLSESIRLGIMQRLHEKDWSGHILAGGDWEHLCLPVTGRPNRKCVKACRSCAKGTTFLGFKDTRGPSESIHETRYPPEAIAAERKALGAYGAAGQLDQEPTPIGGGMFKQKWWRFWRPEGRARFGMSDRPEGCATEVECPAVPLDPDRLIWKLITVDCSFKDKSTSSRVSMQVIGGDGARRYVLDNVTDHMDFVRTCDEFDRLCAKWPGAHKKLVEDKANGTAVINVMSAKISGIVPVEPKGGKESRAAAMSPSVEAGDWYLPDGADWVDDYVNEFARFPRGETDDQVDATSQAAADMSEGWNIQRAKMLGAL